MPYRTRIDEARARIADMRATHASIAGSCGRDSHTDGQLKAMANLEHGAAGVERYLAGLEAKARRDEERRHGTNDYDRGRLTRAICPVMPTGGDVTRRDREFILRLLAQEQPLTERQARALWKAVDRIEQPDPLNTDHSEFD